MGSGWKKHFSTVILTLITVILVASLISHPRQDTQSGQPLLAGAQIDSRVLAVINRGCRDCHSDQVHYPWYSYIAPVSWLVQHDVTEGRQHLNFSQWTEYSILRRERCLSEVANQIQDGGMPLPLYTLIHPAARLSKAERDVVFDWTQAERARLIAQNSAGPTP